MTRESTLASAPPAALSDDEVARVASGLGALGVLAGHRVMLVLGNRIEFVTTYLGVLRAQAVAVPVNARMTAPELARIMVDADRAALECAGTPWIDTVSQHIWAPGKAA